MNLGIVFRIYRIDGKDIAVAANVSSIESRSCWSVTARIVDVWDQDRVVGFSWFKFRLKGWELASIDIFLWVETGEIGITLARGIMENIDFTAIIFGKFALHFRKIIFKIGTAKIWFACIPNY